MCLKNISVCLVLCSGGVHELLSGTEPYPELCGRGRDTAVCLLSLPSKHSNILT